MNRETLLHFRIRWWTAIFIFGLLVSGLTAIPLESEVDFLVRIFGATGDGSEISKWLLRVRDALHATNARHPFLFYGTDWLAFGHVMIAVVFIGVWRNPVKNAWLFDFGLIACVMVIPWAMVFGSVRGIPFFWRLIDCSFGVFGFIPLWFCRRWTRELENRVVALQS